MQSKIRPTSGGFGIGKLLLRSYILKISDYLISDYQVWVGNSLAHGEGCNAIGAYVRLDGNK